MILKSTIQLYTELGFLLGPISDTECETQGSEYSIIKISNMITIKLYDKTQSYILPLKHNDILYYFYSIFVDQKWTVCLQLLLKLVVFVHTN